MILKTIPVVCILSAALQLSAQNITTIAGSDFTQPPSPAPALTFAFSTSNADHVPGTNFAIDTHGNLYMPSLRRVFKVDTSGVVTVFAGNGNECSPPACGDGGP